MGRPGVGRKEVDLPPILLLWRFANTCRRNEKKLTSKLVPIQQNEKGGPQAPLGPVAGGGHTQEGVLCPKRVYLFQPAPPGGE